MSRRLVMSTRVDPADRFEVESARSSCRRTGAGPGCPGLGAHPHPCAPRLSPERALIQSRSEILGKLPHVMRASAHKLSDMRTTAPEMCRPSLALCVDGGM